MAKFFGREDQVIIEKRASVTRHAELFSSFEYGEKVEVFLTLPLELRPGTAFMRIERDEDGQRLMIPGFYEGEKLKFTVYTDEICRRNLKRGLFFWSFLLDQSILSPEADGGRLFYGWEHEAHRLFQLSVYEPGTNRQTGYEGGLIYQIFPDRFCRSGKEFRKDGAVMEKDWYARVSEFSAYPGAPVKNNHFFGGDLYGIAEKIDYLKTLGVTLLYLNPIFDAASNHRYDTGDYMKVDDLLGGEEALKELLARAKEAGIGVILDGVFNHTGSDSLYFNKNGRYPSVGAYQSKESPYYKWYFFSRYPDSYESWWGISILPKVNCGEPTYRDFVAGENGVIEKYLDLGVAGWRLDVVDELNDEMVDAIRARSRKARPDALLYGEVWEDASNKIAYSNRRHYFTGGQLDGVMNYPLKNAIIAFLVDGDAGFLFETEKTLYENYPKAVSDMQMNLLSSHDTVRILNMLAGDPHSEYANTELASAKLLPEERARAKKLLKLAVVIQMFLPGLPHVYYGDEIGMEGDRDPFNRQTYKWGAEDCEVLDFYRRVTALRASLPMLKDAYYRGLYAENGVFVFERFNDSERLVVTINRSNVPYDCDPGPGGRALYPDEYALEGRQSILPGSAAVWYFKN